MTTNPQDLLALALTYEEALRVEAATERLRGDARVRRTRRPARVRQ